MSRKSDCFVSCGAIDVSEIFDFAFREQHGVALQGAGLIINLLVVIISGDLVKLHGKENSGC